MEMIDKEAVIEIITERCLDCNAVVCTKCKTAKMQMKIECLDTVEAEPVRHGYWIECDYKHMEHGFIETDVNGGLCCSECRTGFKKSDLRIKSYCPNCGAKMDGKENEHEF